ncbi:MAG: ATP-binding protein [Thermodesulfobacteriota bacterium]|nr:ATP-binding protein [Thermodesulfobacteriota bacterium]
MPSEFFTFLLYLFYGMAFFAIGVSITSRDTRASNLKIASVLWLFTLFAYSHAFHEWFELYQSLPSPSFPEQFIPLINFLKLALVFVSFGFLLLFGIRILQLVFPDKYWLLNLPPILLVLLLLITILPLSDTLSSEAFTFINSRIRNFIGLPSAACAGLGLILYSRTVAHISNKGAKNFIGAGIALLAYGLLTGVIPSGTHLPIINAPIELFRGLSAFAMLHFFMNALYIFDEERKLLTEERLIRFAKAEKLHALGKLAFGIAHEINNPLANISMNVEMLKSELSNPANNGRTTKRFDTIDRNLDRASKIARELLAFSTDKETEFVPKSLNDIIDSTLELLGSRRKIYRITVTHGDIANISAIPWKLEEVFLNLLVNAMDATPEGGTISITTWQDESQIFAQVSDNGSGIPAELINQVMDPFFTTKEVGQGTGLGLSICYGIMDLHGGSIELESKDNLGTTVTLTFSQEGITDD